MSKMHCDQCEMVSVNGIACHERGCPNAGARWDAETERWVKQHTCFFCGYPVDEGEMCCQEE